MMVRVLLLLLACLAMLPTPAVAATSTEIRIAVLADKGIETAEQEWAYVFNWLNSRMAPLSFTLVGLDHPELRKAIHDHSVDFVITNAGNYSELEHSEGVTRIATIASPLALSPARAVGSAIVVRAESSLTELTDLKDRHVLAASPEAFCCYQIAARELVLAGIDPEHDLKPLEFVGFPIQSIALAVQAGKADAGIVKTCLLEQMVQQGDIKKGALRVLAPRHIPGFSCQTSSRLYPDWPFAALSQTDPELTKRVAVELLEMPASSNGSRWSTPAHYDIVDDLFRDLRIGRYANLQQETIEAMIHRHRIGLAIIIGLFILLVGHTIRVDYLVARRTRELNDMHAEKLRMVAAMRERQAELDHAGRMAVLGGMASAIAHELKQPLAAIANFARGIDRRIESGRIDAGPLRSGCQEIVQQSTRADETIEKIRGFAKKGGSIVKSVNLESFIKEAADLFKVAHPEALIEWSPTDGLGHARVSIDAIQIQQVTFNLLKNAFDSQSTKGNPGAPIAVMISSENHGYRVAVRDKGKGLKEEYMAHLFEPFFTTKADGLGLGLSLSKGIIDAHGGTLELHNEAAGVCASFWLPEENANG